MPITSTQKAQAEQRQWAAAQDGAPQVRLVAGPGTGMNRPGIAGGSITWENGVHGERKCIFTRGKGAGGTDGL
jgi:hypothetical protein